MIIQLKDSTNSTYQCLIDDGDFDVVKEYKLYVLITEWTIYCRCIKRGKHIMLHRLILGLKPQDPQVDYINSNGLDNRKSNLRLASNTQNQHNRRKGFSESKFKGVSRNGTNKWRAKIVVNSKQIHLGYFVTQEEAAWQYPHHEVTDVKILFNGPNIVSINLKLFLRKINITIDIVANT